MKRDVFILDVGSIYFFNYGQEPIVLGFELHLNFDVLLLTGNSSWRGNLCLSLKDKRCVTVILLKFGSSRNLYSDALWARHRRNV